MAVRLAIAALGVVGALVAIHALRADDRCADVKHRASTAPRAALARVADEAGERCGDPRDRAFVAVVLLAHKRRDDAIRLTREMTRANPDDYLGWFALWRVTGDQAALARAHALNPRGTPAPG